jgi:hypothetical protein
MKSVLLDDLGEYEVKGENNSGFVTSKINFEVCSVTFVVRKLVDGEAVAGKDDKFEFTCMYHGKPKPEILWYFNNKSLPEHPYYTVL